MDIFPVPHNIDVNLNSVMTTASKYDQRQIGRQVIRFVTCWEGITLFGSITMLCGGDNIMENILHIHYEWWNVSHNTASPTKHCCGCE